MLRVAVVAVFAVFISFQTIHILIDTQIKGIVGLAQDDQTKSQHWNEATRWSLPKEEILQVIIPGVFGYRMDSPNGAAYWGSVGEDPAVPALKEKLSDPNPEVQTEAINALKGPMKRFSGGGVYAGVLVVVVAFWAFLQSLRAKGSPYSRVQRRCIWFWSVVGFVAVLLAFGRYAPFYQFFYALPLRLDHPQPGQVRPRLLLGAHHPLWLRPAWTGADLSERHHRQGEGHPAALQGLRAGAAPFEQMWIKGSGFAIGAALLGWLLYASNNSALARYLEKIGFDSTSNSPASAEAIASFSLNAVGWFVLLLILGLGLLALIMSGQFTGPRYQMGRHPAGVAACGRPDAR